MHDPFDTDSRDPDDEVGTEMLDYIATGEHAAPSYHHTFDDSGDAYDSVQCLDEIRNGDILICEDGVIGLAWTWPLSVTAKHGEMHVIADGRAAEILTDANINEDRVREAVELAKSKGLPLASWVLVHFGGDV